MALSTAIELKWKEIAKQIVKVTSSFARMAVPDFVIDKVPAIKGFFKGMDDLATGMDEDIQKTGERLRRMEKNLDIKPLTETTRNLLEQESKASIEELKNLRGRKIQLNQNIAKIEVNQDFKDEDPDRILLEFVSLLERIGENAVQSAAAGDLTAFEAGGTL